jgi:site-specific DNA-cytosine methylase
LEGLGVSRKIGLTPEGWQLFRHGYSREASTWTPLPKSVGELREPKVLSIGLFDGIGGLRRSLERLRVRVMLKVSVESDARASRVVREAWPGTVEVSDIRKVTRGFLSTLITAAYELGVWLVILAGGWPCQDVSQLNRHRVGVTGERSSLFREFIRVAQDAQSLAEAFLMKFIGVG